MSHDLFLEEGAYGCFVYLGEAPMWAPSWVTFARVDDVRSDASGPAYRQALKGPFKSREEALGACTALIFKAVKDGTTGL
jgi:hypothetical protein